MERFNSLKPSYVGKILDMQLYTLGLPLVHDFHVVLPLSLDLH